MIILRPQSVSAYVSATLEYMLTKSLAEGVAEGRQIFVNLKRSIQYTISHSTPEVIPQLLCRHSPPLRVRSLLNMPTDVVVPIPLPLSAILILVIGTICLKLDS